MKKFFRKITKFSQKNGKVLRKDITPQGFYGFTESSPRIFKPGEFVENKVIKDYKIPGHLFIHPDSLRNQGAFDFAAKKKKIFTVGIIRTVKGLGDVLILSVIGKALKNQYPGRVKVWFATHPGHEVLLENNPYIDKVFTSEKALMDEHPDVYINVNDLEFKTEIRDEEKIICNRAVLYLDKMGLSVENKTPTYVVTEKEKDWAKKELKKLGHDLQKSIIGIQLYGSNISKTYPHMGKVAEELRKKGYQIFYLDTKPYEYELREIAAIANEMTLMITPNSFFYHLAGALKKRAVALFGYTDGKIWTEDYEKVTPVQILCPKGEKRCWWKIECIPGTSLQEKENKTTPDCLAKIPIEQILEEVDNHLIKRKRVFILVLTYNGLEMTKTAIDSFRSFHDYSIFVVDNVSNDGTIEWLEKNNIKYVSKKTSVAQALNIGLKKAYDEKYDYVLVCNNDIVVEENYIDKVVGIAERRKCLAVSGRIINKGEKIRELPPKVRAAESPMNVTIAGSFSALLLSRKCLEVIGKFDERYYPRYQEDDDYLLRIRLFEGELIYTYSTAFLHLLGQVVKHIPKERINMSTDWGRNVQQYRKKWGFDLYKERNVHMDLKNVKRHCSDWEKKILISLSKKSKPPKIKRYDTVKEIIGAAIATNKKANALIIRRMGGAGDIIFLSVIARALKKYHGNKVNVDYAIPTQFFSILEKDPYIRKIVDYKTVNHEGYDFILDLTDYEYRAELNQVEKYGEIKTARTEFYLDYIKYSDDLKPDYFVSKEEINWAKNEWKETKKKRIGIAFEGSNLMKSWYGMKDLYNELIRLGYCVIQLDERIGDRYKYNFRQMGAVIATVNLVISPDTGASNQAGALNIPVITIFSNRNGKNFEKMFKSMVAIQGECPQLKENYCDYKVPCMPGTIRQYRKKESIRPPVCFQNLKVERVLEEVKKVLQ